MTKVIAKFSNGFEDEYKGTRAVKAAWMIVRKSDGKVIESGHSIDRARADKTSSAWLHAIGSEVGVSYDEYPCFDVPQRLWAGANYSYIFKRARKYGFEGPATWSSYKRWAKAKNADHLAAVRAATTIEIVDV